MSGAHYEALAEVANQRKVARLIEIEAVEEEEPERAAIYIHVPSCNQARSGLVPPANHSEERQHATPSQDEVDCDSIKWSLCATLGRASRDDSSHSSFSTCLTHTVHVISSYLDSGNIYFQLIDCLSARVALNLMSSASVNNIGGF